MRARTRGEAWRARRRRRRRPVAARVLRAFPARAGGGGWRARTSRARRVQRRRREASRIRRGRYPRVVASDPRSLVVDARAADDAAAATAAYLATALEGTALDAGPCGAPEPTAEGDYVELLKMARWAIVRPALVRHSDDEGDACTAPFTAEEARASLVDAVGSVWSRAVVEGPPERRAACVGLLATALPAAVRLGRDEEDQHASMSVSNTSGSLPPETIALWVRPFARLLWELKHRDPATTARASRAIRGRVANPARGRTRGDRARGCRVRTRAVLRARPTAAVGSDGASRARETRAVFASTAEVSGGGGGTPRRAPRAEPGDAPRGGARDARAGCRPASRDARDGGYRV